MLDLTKTYAEIYNTKRKLFYDKKISLKCLRVNEVLIELFDNWYMKPRPTSNLAIGAEYSELEIADVNNNLKGKLEVTTAFEIGGHRFKASQYEAPRALTRRWYFRLEATGEE